MDTTLTDDPTDVHPPNQHSIQETEQPSAEDDHLLPSLPCHQPSPQPQQQLPNNPNDSPVFGEEPVPKTNLSLHGNNDSMENAFRLSYNSASKNTPVHGMLCNDPSVAPFLTAMPDNESRSRTSVDPDLTIPCLSVTSGATAITSGIVDMPPMLQSSNTSTSDSIGIPFQNLQHQPIDDSNSGIISSGEGVNFSHADYVGMDELNNADSEKFNVEADEKAFFLAGDALEVPGNGDDGMDTEQSPGTEATTSELFIGPVIPPPVDSRYNFTPSGSFTCVDFAANVFKKSGDGNFLRGCKWSPDGTQVVTNCNENILHTFTPLGCGTTTGTDMTPNCEIRESGLVYDFAWFPDKDDSKPESCRIACSCPGSPIHLWDSNQGRLVSSYKAFDHCDEIVGAYSLSFSQDGSKLYGGYKNSIRVFDTEYSHHRCSHIKTFDPHTKGGHKGIVSCFCHGPPESHTFVAGSYSRHVGIYYSLTNDLVCLIQGQQGGVTHVMLSPDGTKLYTGGRKDPEVVCWDMRQPGQVLCTFLRDVQTNQRIYFDLSLSGRYLVSGTHGGSVEVWDTLDPGQVVDGDLIMTPCYTFQAHLDCVNGVSLNPRRASLATACGQRHFKDFSDSDMEDCDEEQQVEESSLKIWSIPCLS